MAAIDLMIRRGLGHSIVANLAAVAGLAGCAAFAWVILHDVFPAMDAAAPTSDLVTTIGPPAFLAGLFTLLGLAARLGRLSWLHLALVVLGFGCVVASLDLLPVAALLLLLGFRPLWSSRSGRRLRARTMDRLPPRQGTARK